MIVAKGSQCINLDNCTTFKRDGHLLYFDLIDHPTATQLIFKSNNLASNALDEILDGIELNRKVVVI